MPNTFQGLISFPEFSGLSDTDSTDTKKTGLIFQYHTILNNLSIQLCCPICQDIPTQPYLLPNCGHTFCYSCIKHWLQCNPSCPICRSIVGESKPVLNHTVKNLIDSLIDDFSKTAKLINLKEYKAFKKKLKVWKIEKNQEYEEDRKIDFPWLKKIETNWGRAVVDTEDGVPRCSACHWELVDGFCENCGRTMVGWQDRTDGDELGEEDNDSHLEDNLNSDSDEWRDYDNGMNDRLQNDDGIIYDEAMEDYEEDEGEENHEYGYYANANPHFYNDNHRHTADINISVRLDSQRSDGYDSDDGFVVDEDDELEENDDDDDDENDAAYTNTSDVEILDDENDMASGDEEIVQSTSRKLIRNNDNHKPIEHIALSDYEDEDDNDDNEASINPRRGRSLYINDSDDEGEEDEEEILDDDTDDEFLRAARKGRKKNILLNEEDEEDAEGDEEDQEEDTVQNSSSILPTTRDPLNKRKRRKNNRKKQKKFNSTN